RPARALLFQLFEQPRAPAAGDVAFGPAEEGPRLGGTGQTTVTLETVWRLRPFEGVHAQLLVYGGYSITSTSRRLPVGDNSHTVYVPVLLWPNDLKNCLIMAPSRSLASRSV